MNRGYPVAETTHAVTMIYYKRFVSGFNYLNDDLIRILAG
jgi:hypothetical protein